MAQASFLRSDNGQGRTINNVLDTTATGKITAGLKGPQNNGADGPGIGQSLGQLVADVACVQGRKYQDVRLSGHIAVLELKCRDLRHQRAVELKLTVDKKVLL